ARRHLVGRADRAARGPQADQQLGAAAADRHPRRGADRDRHARPARPLPAAALRADGRGHGAAGAGRSLAALAGAVRRLVGRGGRRPRLPRTPRQTWTSAATNQNASSAAALRAASSTRASQSAASGLYGNSTPRELL